MKWCRAQAAVRRDSARVERRRAATHSTVQATDQVPKDKAVKKGWMSG
jgi:hypothetical protein